MRIVTSGAYSISVTLNAGDALLVYLDQETIDGTAVTVSDGESLSGLDLYADHVITRHDNGGSLTNAAMDAAKGALADVEIRYALEIVDRILSSEGKLIYPEYQDASRAGTQKTPTSPVAAEPAPRQPTPVQRQIEGQPSTSKAPPAKTSQASGRRCRTNSRTTERWGTSMKMNSTKCWRSPKR